MSSQLRQDDGQSAPHTHSDLQGDTWTGAPLTPPAINIQMMRPPAEALREDNNPDKLISSSFYFFFISPTQLQLHLKNNAAAEVSKWEDNKNELRRHQQLTRKYDNVSETFQYLIKTSDTELTFLKTPVHSAGWLRRLSRHQLRRRHTRRWNNIRVSKLSKMSVLDVTSSRIPRIKIPFCRCPPEFVCKSVCRCPFVFGSCRARDDVSASSVDHSR